MAFDFAAFLEDGEKHMNLTPILVDNEKALLQAEAALAGCKRVAFDTEGINLGRFGPLTLASFCRCDVYDQKEPTVAYVVDVQTLGGLRVFGSDMIVTAAKSESASAKLTVTSGGSDDTTGAAAVSAEVEKVDVTASTAESDERITTPLKKLLEDPMVTKVTFDCRTDSEALWHQFKVRLQGTLDLQILDQAVRLQGGESLPERCPYIARGFPLLKGMRSVLTRYSGAEPLQKLGGSKTEEIIDMGPRKKNRFSFFPIFHQDASR